MKKIHQSFFRKKIIQFKRLVLINCPPRQLYARKLVQDLEETEANEPESSFRGFGRSAYSAKKLPKKVGRRETQTNNSVSLPG